MTPEKILKIARRFDPEGPDIVMTEATLIAFAQSIFEAERESSDEPVAWLHKDGKSALVAADTLPIELILTMYPIPLYRHPPPARKLTDEEIEEVLLSLTLYHTYKGPLITAFARAIERRINGEEE